MRQLTSSILVLQVSFLLLVCLTLVNCSSSTALDSLYHSNDSVTILTTSNFTQFAVDGHADGRKVQLIQFYNTWCGHCIAFAPSFKKFVKSVARWRGMLDISVVDCAQDVNRKLCTDMNIESYPTLRLFWFKPTTSDHGEKLSMPSQEPAALRQSILKWITTSWKKGNIPASWPQFEPLTGETKKGLIQSLASEHDDRTVLILVERDASYLGREIMMHLGVYTSQIRLYRMVESSIRLLDQILPKTLDTFTLPFLVTLDKAAKEFKVLPKPIMNKQDDELYFSNLIKSEFIKNLQPEAEMTAVLGAPVDVPQPAGKTVVAYPSRVYLSDLNNAIRRALFHEVPMRKHLTVEQINALIRLLTVLGDNYHFQDEKTRQFVRHLHDYLETKLIDLKRASRPGTAVKLEVTDYLTSMNMYEEYYHFPEMKPWAACADAPGGHGRGFPCAMWSLFHVLTVAEYRRSLAQKQWSSLHASLYAIREYIRHFFGCTDCARHFVSMATDLENELAYPNASVLWLWNAHNTVNARLKGSPSDGAQWPKRQFPTHQECPQCFRTVPDETNQGNATLYRTYYDEAKLLQFLLHFYSAERLVLDASEFEGEKAQVKGVLGSTAPLGSTASSSSEYSWQTGSRGRKNSLPFVPFTSTDYSIIFIFYIVSITLLLSLCAFFKIRRSRNNRKQFQLMV